MRVSRAETIAHIKPTLPAGHPIPERRCDVAKLLWPFLIIASVPLAASAQIIPKVAAFAGYTVVRAQRNGGSGFTLNGWDASVEVKPASWLGIVGDVSQQYGSPSGVRENQTSALFGPQISVPGTPRVVLFAHALVGVVRGTNQVLPQLVPCTPTNCPGPAINAGTVFATAVGGGVDFKLAGPVWVRAFQVEYLHANLAPDHHTQARLAAGIVLRL